VHQRRKAMFLLDNTLMCRIPTGFLPKNWTEKMYALVAN